MSKLSLFFFMLPDSIVAFVANVKMPDAKGDNSHK